MRYYKGKDQTNHFKGSITVTFSTKEEAAKFLALEIVKYNDYALKRQWWYAKVNICKFYTSVFISFVFLVSIGRRKNRRNSMLEISIVGLSKYVEISTASIVN